MRLLKLFLIVTNVLYILACQSETQKESLKIIPVDINQNVPVKLSEIASDIKMVSLELTDESIIGYIQKLIFQDELLIVWDNHPGDTKILIFDCNGKYIRRISNKGQGPREFEYINDISFDIKENIIYLASARKILSYTKEGKFLNECTNINPEYIFFQNGYINFFSTEFGKKTENGFANETMLYRMDNNCNPVDSLCIKSVSVTRLIGSTGPRKDYVSKIESQTFIYFPVLTPEPFVRDTLYEIQNNLLVPFLKLRFSNQGEVSSRNNRTNHLFRIWRSERFVFAQYDNNSRGRNIFMHDLKTGRSANMKDGFIDDIHNTGIVDIHPLYDNYFYYRFIPEISEETNNEEPNPNVYIGTFISDE